MLFLINIDMFYRIVMSLSHVNIDLLTSIEKDFNRRNSQLSGKLLLINLTLESTALSKNKTGLHLLRIEGLCYVVSLWKVCLQRHNMNTLTIGGNRTEINLWKSSIFNYHIWKTAVMIITPFPLPSSQHFTLSHTHDDYESMGVYFWTPLTNNVSEW